LVENNKILMFFEVRGLSPTDILMVTI
jgi:hypothetical protein